MPVPRHAIRAAMLLALALAFPAPARAGQGALSLSIEVPTGECYLGDPIAVSVTLERDASLRGTVEVERPRFPGFEIERYEPGEERAAGGRIRRTDRSVLMPASAGTFEIEIPGFAFRGEDGRDLTIAPQRRTIVVRDVPDWVIDAIDVRDIRPPVGLPRAPRPADRRIPAAFAALLALLLLARALLRRRVPAGPPIPPPPPPVDPWKEFEEAMRRLAGSGLLQRAAFKEYVERLSMALREFLGRAHGIPAPDMTGEELLAWAASRGGALEERLARFVEETDLVKFARAPVERPVAEELRDLAEAIARAVRGTGGGAR